MKNYNKNSTYLIPIFIIAALKVAITHDFKKSNKTENHVKELNQLGYLTDTPADQVNMVLKCKTVKYRDFCKKNKLGEFIQD